MATAVFFHAHPDDEAIATGGTMAKASAGGHRVVLVTATKGEHGEVEDGFLDPGEPLWRRREQETAEAARALGVHRQEFLGYVDSGMMGTAENDAAGSFWQADTDEAAERLARILREEAADVLVVYDDHGLYGHPDHIQVHRVGVRAAELAGTPKVYEGTFDRDYLRELEQMARDHQGEEGVPAVEEIEARIETSDPADTPEAAQQDTFGSPGEIITTRVDVRAYLGEKRRAMEAHRSQISETSFFLAMAPELFELTWGTEFYILRGASPGTAETDLFEGL
ncbi:MAG TPA: PIG-L family deacetylase [Acidimicrobiales bacterium]|nr:PIG-L family deacetylase [Acidimicrobiales bacterium]